MKNYINKHIVWVRIPKAGLGNKILLWANALAFAKKNNLPLITTNWFSIHIGPWLRGEKSKRLYTGYFKQINLLQRLFIHVLALSKKKIKNPDFDLNVQILSNQHIIVFNSYKFWMHYFDNIKNHRSTIQEVFFNQLLTAKIRNEYNALAPPFIGVHVRRGDFLTYQENKQFDAWNTWCTRTPIEYFINTIQNIRAFIGKEVSVSVFSDGNKQELADLLKLNNTTLITGNKDIIDMLQLSKSKIIIPSPGSTFSLLAAFLSNAVILHHPNFWMRPIRPFDINKDNFEGPVPDNVNNWEDHLRYAFKKIELCH